MDEKSKIPNFVGHVFSRTKGANADKKMRAALRKSDNPSTEHASWEYLAHYIDLTNDNQRNAYMLIGSSIARSDAVRNGPLRLGAAIASVYDDGSNNDQAKMKLRRVLACDSVAELCLVLRPTLRLIESRKPGAIDYIQLLIDLVFFNKGKKTSWAQSFYGRKPNNEEE